MKSVFLILAFSASAGWALAGADTSTRCEADAGCAAQNARASKVDDSNRQAVRDRSKGELTSVVPVSVADAPVEVMGFLDPDTIDLVDS